MISCTTVSFSSTCHNVIKLKSYLVTDFFSSSPFSYFSLDISSICEFCRSRSCLPVCVLRKFLFLNFLSFLSVLLSYRVTSSINGCFHLLTIYLLCVFYLVPVRLFIAAVIHIYFRRQWRLVHYLLLSQYSSV